MILRTFIKEKFKHIMLGCIICFSTYAMSQTINVSGTITSASNGEPVIGASVVEKGTINGTITNVNGVFSFSANSGSILKVSSIGFKTIEINAAPNLQIVLEEDAIEMSEVVVTGYITERKADLTGSVTVVNMKDVANIPTGNVLSSLQGRLPGINISTDGTPGSVNTSTLIRGTTTINNSSPLYVIDGIMTRDNLSTILATSDVESIQILKDAASAAIYGAQAANGVIIITTKKAQKGEIRVDFDVSLTAQTYHSPIKMLNAQQWGDVYWKAYQNDGIAPAHDLYGNGSVPVIPEYIYNVDGQARIKSGDTDWAKETYNTALMQTYNMTIAKGTENGSTTLSVNYLDHDGLVRNSNFKRINTRLSSTYSFLNNSLRIGENIAVNRWTRILSPGGIEELVIAQHPIIPVYDEAGGYAGPTYGIGDKPNPIRLTDNQLDNRHEYWRIFGNAFIEIEPINNFVLRSNFGVNYYNSFHSDFTAKWHEGNRSVEKNELNVSYDYTREWVWSNTATYNLISGSHFAMFLIGMEARENYYESLSGYRSDFLLEAIDYRYLNAGSGEQTNRNIAGRTAMVSYFGKANYSYSGKYLLSATIRRDASSRFGMNNNYGVFPSISAGWRVSQESFADGLDWLSDFKLRASWGINGNDLMDDHAKYTKYLTDVTTAGYDISGINSGVISPGIKKDRSGSPNVKWESTTQLNIGIDAAFLNNRLNVAFDWYNKDTEDMLIDRPYIAVIGEGGTYAFNGASLNNRGIESLISWRDKKGDFGYEIGFNFSIYKNKVTDVPEEVYYTLFGGNGRDLSIVGQPLRSWMGYKTDGLYRTQEDLDKGPEQEGKGLGRIRYVDISGPEGIPDGKIDDYDRTWIGTDLPKMIGGLNLAFTYKRFDLSLFFNGMIRDAYNNSKFYTDFFQLWTGNHSTHLLEAWDPDKNFNSKIPALTAVNRNDEGRVSEYYIENGSYIKLKTMQLGYNLPKQIQEKLYMNNARIYLQGQNLFTITKYEGADPEGLGYPYPMPRSFTLGLTFSF